MASTSAVVEQRNQDATLYVGNLDDAVDEELLWELFTQVGPVTSVHQPRDKVSGRPLGFAFVELRTEDDAEYAIKVLNMLKLHGKLLKVNKSAADKSKLGAEDIAARLFVGNLGPDVDEKVLYDTFSQFGGITIPPRITRDPDTGAPKGFGFVTFDTFEEADVAIECMTGQWLGGRQIVVQYAFKRDSRTERHGSASERFMAAAARGGTGGAGGGCLRPNMFFATAPGQVRTAIPQNTGHMIGSGMPAPPPMLPPTAILPASLMPPSLPPPSAMHPPFGAMAPPPFGGGAAAGAAVAAPPGMMMMMGGAGTAPPPPLLPGGFGGGYGGLPPPLPPAGAAALPPPLPPAAAVGGFGGAALPPPLPPPLPFAGAAAALPPPLPPAPMPPALPPLPV